jgi:hypothetical protein
MEADLDSKVAGVFTFQDPSEANILTPIPCFFLLVGPDSG